MLALCLPLQAGRRAVAAHPRRQRAAALRAVAHGQPTGGHAHRAAHRLRPQPGSTRRGHPEEEVFLTVAPGQAGLDIHLFSPQGCSNEVAATLIYIFSRPVR